MDMYGLTYSLYHPREDEKKRVESEGHREGRGARGREREKGGSE